MPRGKYVRRLKTILERVRKNVTLDPVTGCWLWQGSRFKSGGYGQMWGVGGKVKVKVHRALFIELHGPLRSDEFVCHRCDRPLCCNPDHLFKGSAAANAADMVAKGRQAVGGRNGNGRLTAVQVLAIRSDPRVGWRIAADYGVSQAAVSYIKIRRNWGWLEDDGAV